MFIRTSEIGAHVRVSRTLDRVAHLSRETRERKTERRRLNRHASQAAASFDGRPRLRKPDAGLKVIDLAAFKASRPQAEPVEVVSVPATVVSFDKREAVAQEAGL